MSGGVQGAGKQPVEPLQPSENTSVKRPVNKSWRAGGSQGQNAAPNFIKKLIQSVKTHNVTLETNSKGDTPKEIMVRNLLAFIDANKCDELQGVFRESAPSEKLAELNQKLNKNPSANLHPTKMQVFLSKFTKKPPVTDDMRKTACNALKNIVNNTLGFNPDIGKELVKIGKELKENNNELTLEGFQTIKNLPFTYEQRVILDLTIAYMAKVSKKSAANLMDANNLGKILANAFADANPVTALQTEDDIRAVLASIIRNNANPANQPFAFISP